jgi:hypothetical protein
MTVLLVVTGIGLVLVVAAIASSERQHRALHRAERARFQARVSAYERES